MSQNIYFSEGQKYIFYLFWKWAENKICMMKYAINTIKRHDIFLNGPWKNISKSQICDVNTCILQRALEKYFSAANENNLWTIIFLIWFDCNTDIRARWPWCCRLRYVGSGCRSWSSCWLYRYSRTYCSCWWGSRRSRRMILRRGSWNTIIRWTGIRRGTRTRCWIWWAADFLTVDLFDIRSVSSIVHHTAHSMTRKQSRAASHRPPRTGMNLMNRIHRSSYKSSWYLPHRNSSRSIHRWLQRHTPVGCPHGVPSVSSHESKSFPLPAVEGGGFLDLHTTSLSICATLKRVFDRPSHGMQ